MFHNRWKMFHTAGNQDWLFMQLNGGSLPIRKTIIHNQKEKFSGACSKDSNFQWHLNSSDGRPFLIVKIFMSGVLQFPSESGLVIPWRWGARKEDLQYADLSSSARWSQHCNETNDPVFFPICRGYQTCWWLIMSPSLWIISILWRTGDQVWNR